MSQISNAENAMKVTTRNTEKGFSVTFHAETEKDGVDLHDLVAIRVCQGPHDFLGDVFDRLHGEDLPESEYEVPLRERPTFYN